MSNLRDQIIHNPDYQAGWNAAAKVAREWSETGQGTDRLMFGYRSLHTGGGYYEQGVMDACTFYLQHHTLPDWGDS